MSMGGDDLRISSVTSFLQKFPSKEKLFHMLQGQFLSCIASFEGTARRPLSLDPKTFSFFMLGESYFDNSRTQRLLRRLLIFKLPKDCCRNKIPFVPRPVLVEWRSMFPRSLNWTRRIFFKVKAGYSEFWVWSEDCPCFALFWQETSTAQNNICSTFYVTSVYSSWSHTVVCRLGESACRHIMQSITCS